MCATSLAHLTLCYGIILFYLVNNMELIAENNSGHLFNEACVLSEIIVGVLLSSLLISGYEMCQGHG
jgi:hypothetical protein